MIIFKSIERFFLMFVDVFFVRLLLYRLKIYVLLNKCRENCFVFIFRRVCFLIKLMVKFFFLFFDYSYIKVIKVKKDNEWIYEYIVIIE